eukprot:jgi/Bigna1/79073/fgenesh1_pg.59_\
MRIDDSTEELESPPGANNPFLQQRFNCCVQRPVHMPSALVVAYVTYGIISLVIGASALSSSYEVKELYAEYTHTSSGGLVSFDIDEDIEAPIFVYYEITGIYQNHRRYVKSVNPAQLLATFLLATGTPVTLLSPARQMGESYTPVGLEPTLTSTTRSQGICARTVRACLHRLPRVQQSENCTLLDGDKWGDDGIAWPSDSKRYKERKVKIEETRQGYFGYNLTNVDDQEFIVWMRPGTSSVTRKLYRVIRDQDLKKGVTLR